MKLDLAPDIGESMHSFATSLFHCPRSLTGDGVRRTLRAIKSLLPNLNLYEVPSGTTIYDWKVPDEWNLIRATLKDLDGNILIDTNDSYLHLLGYSDSFTGRVSLDELKKHLYYRKDLPQAIPYVTSYYENRWGLPVV